jgi:RNA polymerase sigma-70 factor (ECF subfamily)
LAWCSRIVRDREDAQDVSQEAFIHILRKIHTFRGEAALSTWLYRVVTNTALLWLRRKHHPQTSLDDIRDFGEGPQWRGSSVPVVDAALQDAPARIDLKRAIDQLPAGFKATLLLHDVEDYHHHEIAEILGCSTGTSKSQLHKARRRLRELLSDMREDTGYLSCGNTNQDNLKSVARKGRGRRPGYAADPGPGKGSCSKTIGTSSQY